MEQTGGGRGRRRRRKRGTSAPAGEPADQRQKGRHPGVGTGRGATGRQAKAGGESGRGTPSGEQGTAGARGMKEPGRRARTQRGSRCGSKRGPVASPPRTSLAAAVAGQDTGRPTWPAWRRERERQCQVTQTRHRPAAGGPPTHQNGGAPQSGPGAETVRRHAGSRPSAATGAKTRPTRAAGSGDPRGQKPRGDAGARQHRRTAPRSRTRCAPREGGGQRGTGCPPQHRGRQSDGRRARAGRRRGGRAGQGPADTAGAEAPPAETGRPSRGAKRTTHIQVQARAPWSDQAAKDRPGECAEHASHPMQADAKKQMRRGQRGVHPSSRSKRQRRQGQAKGARRARQQTVAPERRREA